MKKFYIIIAIAVVSLFALSSCNNKNGGDSQVKDVVMKDGKTKAAAKTVKFDKLVDGEKDMPIFHEEGESGNEYNLGQVEFTEDGNAAAQLLPVETKADVSDLGNIINKVFTYTESGGTYTIPGFGTVTISGNSVHIAFEDGSTFDGTATVNPTTTSSVNENNLARTWKVDKVILSVSGNGVSAMKSFNGCNLYEMAKYAVDNGVTSLQDQLDKLEGYNVANIIFTGADSFIFSFTGADAIWGSFSLPSGNKISYTFPEGNAFIHGSASGEYEFPADKKMNVILNLSLNGYTAKVEFALTAAN